MTISSNKLDVSRFDGMKENETSIDENILLDLSQGKKVSGTDNLSASDVQILPSQEDIIRSRKYTHPETNINLKHVANPGKAGFLSAIKNFFKGIFSNDLEIPDMVTVTFAGKKIEVNGERFRGMLEALPKGERAVEAASLETQIKLRLSRGKDILQSVISGNPSLPATTQDVSNLMLFIQLRHVALHPKESFTNGVYSIEDPDGKLADYLDSCKEGYNRSSSHLEGLQDAPLGEDKSNAMRGIDIPGGVTTGLLDKRGTIHYGSIPQQENVENSKRRLFIMTERHGCRLSLRSFKFWTKSFWVNTSGRAHRSMQFSDIGRAICNVFKKSDEKSGINYRSERLLGLHPKDIAETFKGIRLCEERTELKPYFSKNGTNRLPENARLSATLQWLDEVKRVVQGEKFVDWSNPEGISQRREEDHSKIDNAMDSIKLKLLNGTYTDNPNNMERNADKGFFELLKSAGLDQPDRLGNEVMMSPSDLLNQEEEIQQANKVDEGDLNQSMINSFIQS